MDLHRPMEPDRREYEPMDVETFLLHAAGGIPNNPRLPLLLYRGVLAPELRMAGACQSLFKRNRWGGNWVNGIYDYWHFHVTGHEVLGCVAGGGRVGFGGDGQVEAEIASGDVVVIPAGVGHKRLHASADFAIVGGYPPGQSGEISRPEESDFDEAAGLIAELALPETDPVYGRHGPVLEHWRGA